MDIAQLRLDMKQKVRVKKIHLAEEANTAVMDIQLLVKSSHDNIERCLYGAPNRIGNDWGGYN